MIVIRMQAGLASLQREQGMREALCFVGMSGSVLPHRNAEDEQPINPGSVFEPKVRSVVPACSEYIQMVDCASRSLISRKHGGASRRAFAVDRGVAGLRRCELSQHQRATVSRKAKFRWLTRRLPPNRSVERTPLSWPRTAVVDHASRGQLKAAAHLQR